MRVDKTVQGPDGFVAFVAAERQRHQRRALFCVLMVCLIGVVLYETQWPVIRPGLLALLIGQFGSAALLMIRIRSLTLEMKAERPLAGASWFLMEERFLQRLAWFETGCQLAGFILLGYGLWQFTGNILLALAIGLAYPASVYFGVTQKRNLAAIGRLRAQASRQEYGENRHTADGNLAG